jgi:integrase/recombinase XerD
VRAFPVRLPSGVRYWTVLNEDLAVVAEADAFLRHVRFGRDGSELTTRSYAGAIALFLRWCVRTSRDWHDGVAALGLFITWLRHAGPQSSGVEVVAGGQVLAGPGVADKSLICPLGASSMAQASTGSIPVSRTT